MSADNFLCSDNQQPCSSTAPGFSYPHPQSNMSNNPDSPFSQASGPPSRNMTPGHFHQRTDPMQTHMWLQSHHDTMSYNQRPYSAAPSVMSNMTRISGMSAISINTQATTMSYSNNQLMGMPSGPLSSSSHCENIDPRQDWIEHMKQLISCLADDEESVRTRAAEIIKACPKRLKEAPSEIVIEIVPDLLRKTVYALNAEKVPKTKLILCDAVAELVRGFCPLAAKMVRKEKNDPGGILAGILNFAKHLETSEDKRRLRHLIPAIFSLFLDESSCLICLEAAKATELFYYLCSYVTELFKLAKNGRNPFFAIKLIIQYFDGIRYQLSKNVEYKKYVIKNGIHFQMLELLQFLERFLTSNFEPLIRYAYKTIIYCFKQLVAVNLIEIVDKIVESQFIQYFMYFRAAFDTILPISIVEFTYECFTYVTDSEKLKETSKDLPSPKKSWSMIQVLYHDFNKAINERNSNLCQILLQFECNGCRIPGFINEAIHMRHHLQIIFCLNSATQQFRHQSEQVNENVDNCLMILQKYADNCDINLISQFFDELFVPEVISNFSAIFQKSNLNYIFRILKIWLKCIHTVPEKLLKFSDQQVPATSMVLFVIVTNVSLSKPHNSLVELAIDIYKLLILTPAFKREIIQSLQHCNLFELINQQENPEIILKLLPLTHQLWQSCIEIKHFIDGQMREMLSSLRNSTNSEIARQVQQMISIIEIETDDFVPPLANAFSFDSFP